MARESTLTVEILPIVRGQKLFHELLKALRDKESLVGDVHQNSKAKTALVDRLRK